MRAVVVGAGLGGLATALRLQGAGLDVTVVEGRPTPGGRAAQIVDNGFTWDTGPSLITMPWVLEDVFAAGGLDLDTELSLSRLDPFYRLEWQHDDRHLDFVDRERMPDELARFSARDARAFEPFMAALKPIYEDGIIAAGRRPFGTPGSLAGFVPRMVGLGAAQPLARLVAKHFEHPRVREAMSFHSLFIGGDPHRVPAIYGALVYLQFLDGVWYADGGVYSMVEAMARPLDVRYGDPVVRVETERGRVTGVWTRGGERIAADVVVSNTDVMVSHELLNRPVPWPRRLQPTMSCFLLCLGTNKRFERLRHHHLLVSDDYRGFVTDVTRRGRLPKSCCVYIHAPSRTEPGMAAPGGDSLCILLPVPNLEGGQSWARESDNVREWLMDQLEQTYGLAGLRDATVVEHRMTPDDFERRFDAWEGNAFGPEPTLQQSAFFRQHNRDDHVRGMYHVGAGTHPGAGIPGVVLGAEVTAGLVLADARTAGRATMPDPLLARARAVTEAKARTFALACRLLPHAVRDDVYRLYFVFRTLDDLVDSDDPRAATAVAAVEAWAAGGRATTAETEALAAVDARTPLPRDALADFCAGMRFDLGRGSCDTEADLDRYCHQVAGTVGLVMAAVLGTDGEAGAAAAALGAAMQRTNILRDIDEDLAAGRVYLARETVDRFGGSLEPGLREALLRDQIARADALYDEGLAGIDRLRRGRGAIRAAAAMYREILREIERQGYGAQPGRVSVSPARKLLAAPALRG